MEFERGILNLDSPIVFFPVRHHSPVCARLVRQLALEIRPAAILIEGPFDFNPQISELFLPHKLPIAIYSYTRSADGTRRGAFYPFCIYSPEWQALQIAHKLDIPVQFIDLPWAEIASVALSSHRYADTELRRSSYVTALCEQLGVEGLNELWDLLFEIDPELSINQYMERCHQFCFHCRISDGCFSAVDLQREEFMASQIRAAIASYSGQILVVTGGFHSYALYSQLTGKMSVPQSVINQQPSQERGIALTPFTYERLDNLTGYDAGMPSPGFYHQVWHDRLKGKTNTYRQLLARVVKDLRQRNQIFSAADLIAVEITAKGLSALRGHKTVWRQDLIDGMTASLIKEALDSDRTHPVLVAIYQVLRGNIRGHLADETSLPPLVENIKQLVQEYDLETATEARVVNLNLHERRDLKRSQILHQLRILGIAGYERTDGSDLVKRDDLSYIWEQWVISWSPHYEASCIENSIYGATLAEAAEARLLELATEIEQAEKAALLLLDACLMGLALAEPLYQQLQVLICSDSNFFSLTGAVGHLLYLYRYDEVLGTTDRDEIGRLLVEAFARALWLLESLGHVQGQDLDLLQGIQILLETLERCGRSLPLNRTAFIDILQRVSANYTHPLLQGAATGVLWTLGAAASDRVILDLRSCAEPNLLGDFLTGLFCLAREAVQRHPHLLLNVDELIASYDDETFLVALPAIHLAFTYFTTREKHTIASTLVKAWGNSGETELLPNLEVSAEMTAQVRAFETKLFQAAKRYGLRGGRNESR